MKIMSSITYCFFLVKVWIRNLFSLLTPWNQVTLNVGWFKKLKQKEKKKKQKKKDAAKKNE